MQVSTTLQTDNHASTPPLSFLQAGCPSCRPTNSVKALKASNHAYHYWYSITPHSFIPGLKLYSSANPSHRSLPFFFRTYHMDSPDCLLYF